MFYSDNQSTTLFRKTSTTGYIYYMDLSGKGSGFPSNFTCS
jgi:hypothetical protein